MNGKKGPLAKLLWKKNLMHWYDTVLGWGLRTPGWKCQMEMSYAPVSSPTKNDPWQPAWALLICLTLLTSRENFFWITSQGEAKALFSFLFWSWLRRNVWSRKKSLLKKPQTLWLMTSILRSQLGRLLIIWVLNVSLWIILTPASLFLFLWKFIPFTFHWLVVVSLGNPTEDSKVVKLQLVKCSFHPF